MLLIVDAYNVLKKMSATAFVEEGQRNAFIKKIEQYAQEKNNRVTVVFDGGGYPRPTTYRHGMVHVIYAGIRDSADDVIKQILMRGVNPSQTILVSSDRELCMFATQFQVPSLDSYDFYVLLHQPVQQQKMLIMAKSSDQIRKMTGNQSSQELDDLMAEASKSIMHKAEDTAFNYNTERKSNAKQEKKQDKKLGRLVKKL